MGTRLIRDDDGRELELGVVTSYRSSPSVTVSRHPQETGSEVVDHMHREPLRVSLGVRFTKTPLDNQSGAEGAARLDEAKDFFDDTSRLVRGQRNTLSIEYDDDRIRDDESMILTGWPLDVGVTGDVGYRLEFIQIQFGAITFVAVPDKAVTSSGTASEAGSNGTDSPTDSDVSTFETALRGTESAIGFP